MGSFRLFRGVVWRRAATTMVAGCVLTVSCLCALAADDPPVTDEARAVAQEISGRQVAARVRFLSSPFFEGREAGTRGERLAAEYLRDFYLGLGLTPGGEDGSFYQFFDLHQVTLGPDNAFSVIREGTDGAELATDFALDEGFVPFNFSPSARVEAPVVFAGYGISSEKHEYDDYDGLDVRGAIVLVLRHEPRENDPDSPFKGLRSTRHAAFLSKVRLAQKLGAVGLLLVTDPLAHDADSRDAGNGLARWSSLRERGEFDTRPAPDPVQMYPEVAPDVRIPAMHISYRAAGDLLSGTGLELDALQQAIDEELKPASRRLKGMRARMQTDIDLEKISVRNVVARLEGSDPSLKNETIVVGGHYDHVGYGHFGSNTGHWGKIHPGADDNASGTAVISSLAEALARAPQRPRRSVVFMHFTAEEKGLMGSRWFVEHPTLELDKVVAMINLDMVGRNEPRVLSIVGDSAAAGLDALIKSVATSELGMAINNDAGSGIDRSDQWAFALKGIPSIAFFSGIHDDYHGPSDTASKIVPDKLENVARLTALTVWAIAQQGAKLIGSGADAGGE